MTYDVHMRNGQTFKVNSGYYYIGAKTGYHVFDNYPNSNFYPSDIVARFPPEEVLAVIRR